MLELITVAHSTLKTKATFNLVGRFFFELIELDIDGSQITALGGHFGNG